MILSPISYTISTTECIYDTQDVRGHISEIVEQSTC